MRNERIDVNDLLKAIQAECEVALHKVDFKEQVINIRKISFLIAYRIKKFNE